MTSALMCGCAEGGLLWVGRTRLLQALPCMQCVLLLSACVSVDEVVRVCYGVAGRGGGALHGRAARARPLHPRPVGRADPVPEPAPARRPPATHARPSARPACRAHCESLQTTLLSALLPITGPPKPQCRPSSRDTAAALAPPPRPRPRAAGHVPQQRCAPAGTCARGCSTRRWTRGPWRRMWSAWRCAAALLRAMSSRCEKRVLRDEGYS